MECEKTFEKYLKEAYRSENNNLDLEKIGEKLSSLSKILIDTYVKKNEWTKFFDLIDKIQQFRQSIELDKMKLLKIDQIYQYIGDVFYQVDYILNALEFYKKSIELSKRTNLTSIESFENLVNNTIERWHYRMINDKIRNLAYSTAIYKKISKIRKENPNRTINILDIGTGTGLLSALCLSNSVNFGICNLNVFACEQNELFFKISENFLKNLSKNLNKFKINVKILKKHSNDLNPIDDLDNNKIDLIITEIFDDGLLGEGCLSSFYNAICVNKLLAETETFGFSASLYSKIIPQSAKCYVCAIQSDYLRLSNKFVYKTEKQTLNFYCLDNSFNFETYSETDSNINFEPYTTDNLNIIPFDYLTNPVEINEFNINFEDKKFLERKFNKKDISLIKKRLKVIQDGILDAYVLWFDLNLDEEISITNSPLSNRFKTRNTQNSLCWHQAIFTMSQDVKVCEGQYLDIDLKQREDCFLIFDKVNRRNFQISDEINFDINRVEIALLNNDSYQNFYIKSFEEIEKIPTKRSIKVGFLFNHFSILFFKLIIEYIHIEVEIFVNNIDDYYIQMIEKHFLSERVRLNFVNEILTDNKSFNIDFLIYEPIDFKYGTLRKNEFYDLLLIKDRTLNQDMVIFPSGVKLKGMCIESRNFLNESELVSNRNLCLNKIDSIEPNLKEILQDYNVDHQFSLSINNNIKDFKQLSEIKEIAHFDLSNINVDSKFEINPGNCEFKINESGHVNAFLYWYDLVLSDSKFFSPYQSSLVDKHNCSNVLAGIKLSHLSDDDTSNTKCCNNDIFRINYLFKSDVFHIIDYEVTKRV